MASTSDLKKTCPMIRRIPVTGGLFATFPSAAEDLTLSFSESASRKFKFSKFACLNLPDILNQQFSNTMKLNAIPGAYNSVNFGRTDSYNILLAESFQNYCLNLETMVLSSATYDYTKDLTTSERVLFKWLKETGALRFTEQTITGLDGVRYTEESDSDNYNRVVKYIGDVDVVNNYWGSVNSYTEVYVHLPTEVGDVPDVLFKSVSDVNYAPGMTFCRSSEGLDNEIISGRHYNDSHPDNLDIHAFYDNDSGLYLDLYGSSGSYSDVTGIELYKKKAGVPDAQDDIVTDYDADTWWYERTSNSNCYLTQPEEFTDPGNEDLAMVTEDSTLKFRRSKLDGISIDFDPATYNRFNPDLNVASLIDIARSPNSKDFEFNTILLYYDLYEQTLVDGVYVNTVYATNLFGVLFLDNVEPTSLGGGYIPRSIKCKPNSVFNLNGNAYGFRINMKLNTSVNDSGVEVETIISDSGTFALDVFADAMGEVFRVSQGITDSNLALLAFEQRLRSLEDTSKLSVLTNYNTLVQRLGVLESKMNDASITAILKDKTDILSLIDRNYQLLNNILTNKTPLTVAFDLDTLKGGPGMDLEKKENQLILSASNQNFNYSSKITLAGSDWVETQSGVNPRDKFMVYEVELMPLTNYIRFDEGLASTKYTPRYPLKFYIKDFKNKWEVGQVFRLYFATPYDMRGTSSLKDMYIYTDYSNSLRAQNNYSALIKIPFTEFDKREGRPVIEIHCTDSTNFSFIVDYLN